MARSGTSAVRIIDSDNEVVQVTSNALDVNIAGGATIDIGDVEVKGHAAIANTSNIAVGTSREPLTAADTPCKHVDLQADIANTGIIYVGGTAVGASGLNTGIALYAGDVYSIDIENLNLINVIATVADEDIHVTYFV